MPIKGYNFAPSIFLLELSTQCQFARECHRRLRDSAPAWFTNATAEQFAKAIPPRDIMINCAAFLSAAGVISKLLFAVRRRAKKIMRRCERLRELLKIKENDLPVLQDLAVRNRFEHVDERLDKILPSFAKGGFSPLSVHEKEPDADVVLKRFDPKSLIISFADAKISVANCMAEISSIERSIDAAFKKLQGSKFELWS